MRKASQGQQAEDADQGQPMRRCQYTFNRTAESSRSKWYIRNAETKHGKDTKFLFERQVEAPYFIAGQNEDPCIQSNVNGGMGIDVGLEIPAISDMLTVPTLPKERDRATLEPLGDQKPDR